LSETSRLRRIWNEGGAGAGYRTLTCRLKAGCSATELHPQGLMVESGRLERPWRCNRRPWLSKPAPCHSGSSPVVPSGINARSDLDSRRQKHPLRMQHRLNDFADPQGQGSLRPSFSMSSLWPATMRSPRLTCVSDGKPLRRLLITSKAQVVFVERFHGTSPSWL
jgi:hypothetical protein